MIVLDSTDSSSINDTVNGTHHFTIRGYSLAKGMGPGKYVSSHTFTIGGYDWAIYFYPDGKNPEDSSAYVSVFIALASEGTDVSALFELALLDLSGKAKHKVHSSSSSTEEACGKLGYKRFFRRSALETSDFLKGDCLSMQCTSLKHLLDTELGCDVVFLVGNESFKAHKLVLAARSPVFRAQFFGLVGNPNSDTVELQPSIFKVVVTLV
ncbi:hypothetical protein SASPL_104845 [Salvia splendens]|uniref:Speckle-type POZ protein n=1 Tax=Salvia splendens TaxID=180675 RepID=A0A8X8YMG5_SALSN|nr:hypothetical protein SASPL_104845 [Salvia splendens]